MYMPPLFPTLLRTTGAGFCYNIGRLLAAAGTVFFGLFSNVGDHRLALLYAGWLFLPAAAVALFLAEPPDEQGAGCVGRVAALRTREHKHEHEIIVAVSVRVSR